MNIQIRWARLRLGKLVLKFSPLPRRAYGNGFARITRWPTATSIRLLWVFEIALLDEDRAPWVP